MPSNTHEYRKAIGEFVWFALNRDGSTIPQLVREGGCRRLAGDDGQLRYADSPKWHSRRGIIEYVATEMRIDPRQWGPRRIHPDFENAIDQEIAKLRRSGQITDWAARSGIFRPTHRQTQVPRPSADAALREPAGIQPDATDSMKGTFVSILRRGKKDNTYKFALARALLEYCRDRPYEDDSTLEIPYKYFAEKFLKYYWDQECRFRIRQNHRTDAMPHVTKEIRRVSDYTKVRDLDRLDDAHKRRALDNILRTVFGHARSKTSLVVPRFQNVSAGRYSEAREVFYTYDDDRQTVRLRPQAFAFFRENHAILNGTVMVEWAKFLERINGSLPMLIAKIENAEHTRRHSLREFREAYCPHTDSCFYCCGTLEDTHTHVDHFLPWSYIFENSAWNMVLACRDCNLRKSDSLAKGFLPHLIERNRTHRGRIPVLEKSICTIDTRLGWEREIENHYTTCQEYGFAEILMQ